MRTLNFSSATRGRGVLTIKDTKAMPMMVAYYVEDQTLDGCEDRVVLVKKFDHWGGEKYVVRVGKSEGCGCLGWKFAQRCRHVAAVKKLIEGGKI